MVALWILLQTLLKLFNKDETHIGFPTEGLKWKEREDIANTKSKQTCVYTFFKRILLLASF